MSKYLKNYVNPHQHAEYSIDGGSTVEAMIDKDRELEVGYSTLTDHGTMAGSLKHYHYCKKKGIKPILGLEAYFQDPDCSIVKDTESEPLKYFHMTMHFCDSKAFHKGVEILSDADKNAIIAGGERKPIIRWKHVEELASHNVTFCSSCLIGMVGRHLMVNRPDLAEKYYVKIRDMVGKDNFYVEVFAHECDHYWQNGVQFTLEGGDTLMVYPKTRLDTNGGEKIHAEVIAANPTSHTFLKIRYFRQQPIEINKPIVKVERIKDFVKQDDGDIQLKANEFMLNLARKYKDKIIISDDAHYANKEDKVVQNMKLGESFRFYGSYHRHGTNEVVDYFKSKFDISDKEIEEWVDNSYDFASHFDHFNLEYTPTLPTFSGDTLKHTAKLIAKHNRMDWKDKAMVHRLKYELDALHKNGTIDLLPYNFPIEKVCDYYKKNGRLTGPGRGSATGSILCYLLNITQINPLKFGLLFERYISPARIINGTLPDIDLDLPSRDLLVGPDGNHGYLHEEYGDRVSQISTDTMMRLKSAIKDINRFFNKGFVEPEIENLAKGLPGTPTGVADNDFVFGYEDSEGHHIEGLYETSIELQDYASRRPEEWAAVVRTIGITRQKSRHACAYVIGHKPIKEIVPTCTIGGIQGVTQYTAKWVEEAGLIKYDFLVINSLNDITQTMINIKNRYGHTVEGQLWDDPRMFPHNGQVINIWDLPEDPEVYKEISKGKTEGVFQLNTPGVVPTIKKIQPKNIMDLATITALERPGPKNYRDPVTNRNMVEEYIERRYGRVEPDIPYLAEILPDTYGVICFQEQLMTVGRELAGFDPIEADDLRRACAKKKMKDLDAMKPRFMEVASTKVGKVIAEKIWDMMITFGRYGFSINHAVPYVHISYACSYLKYYYPLEWWAAVLSNAKKDEITNDFWPYVKDIVMFPDINKSGSAFEIQGDKIRASIDLLDGVGESAKEAIITNRPYKNIQDFANRVDTRKVNKSVVCSLIVSGVLDSLFENNPLNENGKMLEYMKALTQRDYEKKCLDKKEKCKIANKEYKVPKFPKILSIPPKFTDLNPTKIFQLRKGVLPTIPEDMMKLIMGNLEKYSSKLRVSDIEGFTRISALDKYGKFVTLINADGLRRMKSLANHENNIYFCVPCYTIDVRKFSYKNGTKHAAELKLDVCGSIESMVKWGDYNTGVLDIPHNLKGSISLLFLTKKSGKDPFIYDIILLEEPLNKSSKEKK